jgi:hypothetical protein
VIEPATSFGGRLGITGTGTFQFETGGGWRRLAARALGFPAAGPEQVALTIVPGPPDVWTRRIGHRRIVTAVERAGDVVVERLGPIVLLFSARTSGPTVELELLDWALRAGGVLLALPAAARPAVAVRARRDQAGPHVEVQVRDWQGRLVVGYRGSLSAPARGDGAGQ